MKTELLAVPLTMTVLLSGCGGSKVQMADISGTITYKGKPLANAEVHFVSGDSSGYGRTDEKGHYELVRGAPVGKNKVYITTVGTKSKTGAVDTSIEGMDPEQMRAMHQGAGKKLSGDGTKSGLPPEYSDPAKTKLEFDVPPGGSTTADFKLN